jgi:hypothetical protein
MSQLLVLPCAACLFANLPAQARLRAFDAVQTSTQLGLLRTPALNRAW